MCLRPRVLNSRCLVRENKVNEKSHKTVYFTTLPRGPRERIFTRFGTNTAVLVVINRDKLFGNLFKGFDFTGVKFSIFPLGN